MSDDILIGVTGVVPTGGSISKKPSYLITLEGIDGKAKSIKKFITLDKPELLNGFLQAKGFYSELPEDEIIKNYSSILTSTERDLILEMMMPWHKICSVRSLVFKAK